MVKEEATEEMAESSPAMLSPRKSSSSGEKQCTLCHKYFVTTSSANRHLRTIHSIDTSQGNAGYIIDKVPPSEEDAEGTADSTPPPVLEKEKIEKIEARTVPQKTCYLCHKSFSTGSTLNRHLRRVHGVDTSKVDPPPSLPSGTLDCAISSLILSALPHPLEITVDSKEGIEPLFREVKEEEPDEEPFPGHEGTPLTQDNGQDVDDAVSETASREYDECLEIRCDLCGKAFSQPSTLNRHLREIHKLTTIRKEQPMKPTACPVCGEILRSQSLALRHRREVHGSATKITRLGTACTIEGCEWTGHTHRDLVSHAQSAHSSPSSPFEWQSRSFKSKAAFDRWLEAIRSQGVEWYSRSSKTVDGVKQEYRYCFLEIGGRGKKEHEEKRRIHCTSYIKLVMHDDRSVSAEFCLDHLGHEGKGAPVKREKELEETKTEDGEMTEEELTEDHAGLDQSAFPREDLDDSPGPSGGSQKALVDDSSLISDLATIENELGLSTPRARRCHNCSKEFSCSSTLYRHLREVHKEDHPKSETLAIKTPCAVCGEIFPSGSQMRAHRSTAHPGSLGHRMNCPIEECGWNGSTHRDLIKHARLLHSSPDSSFIWQTRSFTDQGEFNEWLEEQKKRGVHFYIRRSEKRRSLKVENRCCYFEENRARGVSSPSRQRKKFSKKSVGSCTCYLTLTIHDDGSIATGYCLDHLGHTVDLDERPFKNGREEREEDEDEDEEEEEGELFIAEDDIEEEEPIDIKPDLDELLASLATPTAPAEPAPKPITVHDLHRFQESLARLSAGAARLQYSHEMDRLMAYLDGAFTATGLLGEEGGMANGGVKRRMEEKPMMNGKRWKREE